MFDMSDTLPAGYGEHAMERQDTNNPLAFPGNVTNADRVVMRTPPDASGGLVQHSSPYGAPGTTYGAPIVFTDPNAPAYVYSVDLATGSVTILKAPPGQRTGTVLPGERRAAYDAIMSLAKSQAQVQVQTGGGWQKAAEAGAAFLNAYTAQRYPGSTGVPAGGGMPVVDPNAQQTSLAPPSTGIPWWVWAAGATVIGVVVWQATKGGSRVEDDE
jgi:hypothetical protein